MSRRFATSFSRTLSIGAITMLMMVGTGCSGEMSDGSDLTAPNLVPGGIAAEVERVRQLSHLDGIRNLSQDVIVEERISDCMAELGFEYYPAPLARPLIPTSELVDLYEGASRLHPSSIEFRESYGYGVTTLSAYLYIAVPVASKQLEHEALMSDAQYQVYERSLWGSGSGGGCVESAMNEVMFHNEAGDAYWAYNDALEKALERAGSMDEYVRSEAQWAACARGAGFEFSGPSDLIRYFDSRLDDILELPDQDVSVSRFGPISNADMVDSNEDIFEDTDQTDGLFDLDALARLQAEEIAMASRLDRCDTEFIEATQDLLNRLAAEELSDTQFTLAP